MRMSMLMALGVVTVACAGGMSPTASVRAAGTIQPQHNNITATFAEHPEGPVIWLCATQPREYILPSGEHVTEEDHYLQYEPCPSELVK